jgi:FKBP-type peptidyl-prolyl cis-trans isomerase
MFKKYELIGAGVSIGFMALALFLIRLETTPKSITNQSAQLSDTQQESSIGNLQQDLQNAVSANGELNNMVIDDVKIGTGEDVKVGDTVSVHYIGTLQGGQEFDNSKKRGSPFEFKVGAGQVIKGWDEGIQGMKIGGQRILVIPPEMAYGDKSVGPIPPDSTLIFAVELLSVNE